MSKLINGETYNIHIQGLGWIDATWYDSPYNCFYFLDGVTRVKGNVIEYKRKYWC